MGCISQSKNRVDLDSLGSFRKAPDTHKNVSFFQDSHFSYGAAEMCGWRRSMEDAMIIRCPTHDGSDVSLFGIFDGHGGSEIAKYLSENLAAALYNCEQFRKGDYAASFKNNFLKVDQYLRSEEGRKEISKLKPHSQKHSTGSYSELESDAGSTAVLVLVTPTEVYVAHTGDSKAVLVNKGQIVFETKDHKPNHPLELERINSNGGYIEKERICGDLGVSRGFGDFHYKVNEKPENQLVSPIPEVAVFQREEVEMIMLGCDGVWETKETTDIIDEVNHRFNDLTNNHMLTDAERLTKALEQFMDGNVAKTKWGCEGTHDNMSSILIKLN